MGTSIDGFDNLCSAKSDNDKHTKVKNMIWSKYALLTVIGVTAVFSVQISGFFDPISIFTRTFVTVIYPMIDFIFQGSFGFLYQFIFLEDIVFKIEETLRGTLLPLNPVAFRGSMLIGLIFLMILSLAFLQKRSWCRNFCPLGALLALFSKFRWYRRRVSDDCTSCKLCYKNCRMGAIHSDYVSTDHL